MEGANEKGAISSRDRFFQPTAERPLSDAEEEAKPMTTKDMIMLAANKMVERLHGLKVVQEKPELLPLINNLLDENWLYSAALLEHQAKYQNTKDMNAFAMFWLARFKLARKDIPDTDFAKLQLAVQLIIRLFREKVFNTEQNVKKFQEKKAQ